MEPLTKVVVAGPLGGAVEAGETLLCARLRVLSSRRRPIPDGSEMISLREMSKCATDGIPAVPEEHGVSD